MYIGIDLGGTNIAAGVVDEAGRIIYKSSVPTMAQSSRKRRGTQTKKIFGKCAVIRCQEKFCD